MRHPASTPTPGPTRWTPTSTSTTSLGTGGDARGPAMLMITEGPTQWTVRQILDDPAGDHDWGISATVDLAESAERGIAAVRILAVDRL